MVTSTGFEPVNAAVKGRCVKPLHQLAINNGARNRTRTCDLPVNSRTLYRLSYSGTLLVYINIEYADFQDENVEFHSKSGFLNYLM